VTGTEIEPTRPDTGRTRDRTEGLPARNPHQNGQSDQRPQRRRAWAWLVAVLVVAALAGGYWYWKHRRTAPAATAAPGQAQQARTVPVAAVPVRQGQLDLYIDGLGAAAAFNTVTVRPRVDGQLVNVAYGEGQEVRQGDLLAEIDPRPFQAALAQAQGQLARDEAQLHNAQLDLKRYQDAPTAVTQQQVDTQASTVRQYEGVVQTDRAQVESAQLQLSYCRITSPIDGRAGLRIVDVGNMVHANDPGGLVVITQLHPISVVFSIPQDSIGRVQQKVAAGERLPVDAYSRDLTTRIATGTLQSIDNQVDQGTGTIRLKAAFENKDGALFPNQFVNARLLVETLRDVLLVPTAAVQNGPDSTFAYVVKVDQSVEMRPVELGPVQGEQAVIARGLEAGEVVVTDGVDKLQQGSKVTVARGATTRPSGGRGPATQAAAGPSQDAPTQRGGAGQAPGAPRRDRGSRK
jgi:multidrug efflux system membrane fusion protein